MSVLHEWPLLYNEEHVGSPGYRNFDDAICTSFWDKCPVKRLLRYSDLAWLREWSQLTVMMRIVLEGCLVSLSVWSRVAIFGSSFCVVLLYRVRRTLSCMIDFLACVVVCWKYFRVSLLYALEQTRTHQHVVTKRLHSSTVPGYIDASFRCSEGYFIKPRLWLCIAAERSSFTCRRANSLSK